MMDENNREGLRFPWHELPLYAAGVAVVLGVAVLLGWLSGAIEMTSIVSGWATMKPNTALGFLLSGLSLFSLYAAGDKPESDKWTGVVPAALVMGLAFEALVQYALGIDFGVDHWGLRVITNVGGDHQGSMSMATGFSFACIGLALILAHWRGRLCSVTGEVLAGMALLVGLQGFIGSVYGVDVLYAVSPFSSMAVHTSAGFLVLGCGVLTLRTGGGIMELLVSRQLGSGLVRRSLPLALLLPLILGWVTLQAVRSDVYGYEFGLAAFAISLMLVFTLLLWLVGRRLNRVDAHRQKLARAHAASERKAHEMLESLPQLVWTCTPEGPCDYLGPQWIRYTGISQSAQLDYGWVEQVHPDDRDALLTHWNETAGVGHTFDGEFRLRRHDGHYRWFKTTAVAVRDTQGKITKWFGTSTDIDDARHAQVVRARLAAIVESSEDAIIGKTLEGFVTSWNSGAVKLFGYTEEEMLGQKISKIIPVDRLHEEARILQRVASGMPVENFRTVRLKKGGHPVDISVTISPVYDAAGKIIGASKVARDISDQLVIEDALRRSRDELEERVMQRTAELQVSNDALRHSADQLAQAQRVASLGSWVFDVTTGEVHWSDELYRIVGLDPAKEAPNYAHQESMFEPDSWAQLTAAVNQSMATGEGYELEVEVIRPDGTRRWAVARAITQLNETGKVAGLTGTFLDITVLKQARADLEAASTRMRLAVNAAELGVWDWNVPDNTVNWDDQMNRFYGHEGAVNYEVWRDALIPDDRPAAEEAIARALRGEKDFDHVFRIRVAGVGIRFLHGVATVLRDSHGNPLRMVGVDRDVTAIREAEQELARRQNELQRSNRDLEQFAYVASHDLQEPLRAVSGCVQLLKKRYTDQLDAQAAELIEHTVDGAKRMQELIHDLLAYSRVGAGKLELCLVNLQELLKTALLNLKVTIDDTSAVVTQAPDFPVLAVDNGQMVQLFQNLVGNALKYRAADRAPEIHINVQRDGEEWHFSVSDNGIGIEPRYFERIFVIFQRLHTRTEYSGSGIGLSICKRIVDRHNGRIWVESIPAKGTIFHFTLPIVDAPNL